MIVRKLINQAWDSPTITTWATFLSRPLNLLLLTPLIVTRFSIEETSVWFLFNIYLGLQSLADFGLNNSLTRAYAYAYGGATSIKIFVNKCDIESTKKINWDLAEKINSSLTFLLIGLSIIFSVFLIILGTLSLLHPISQISNYNQAWVSWAIIIFTSAINIYGYKYTVYIKGMNNIPLFMRWQTLFAIFSIITSSFVIYMTSNLLAFVATYQFWVILNVIRNKYLANHLFDKQFKAFKISNINKEVFSNILPSAWRTWLAQFMSYGLIQISGIFYAQIGDPSSTAMYLFSLKIINFIKQFSNAPFYSRLPELAKYFIEKKFDNLLITAKRGMFLSHFSFILLFILIGFIMDPLLNIIDSKIVFANPILWCLLGASFWFERYGAMHYQLYGLTNRVVAHIGNGVTGFIYIILVFLLINKFQVYTFPISYMIACLLFYCWYGVLHSKSFFKYNYFKFEISTSLLPFIILSSYLIIIYIRS